MTAMLVTSLCWWLYDGDHVSLTMWCWWPICYVGHMKFNQAPNSIKLFPSLNRSWGTYIGDQHHNTPECDVGDWYLTLVPNSRCWWRDLSPTSKSCHQHSWSPTSVTNIDITLLTWRTSPSFILNGWKSKDLMPDSLPRI